MNFSYYESKSKLKNILGAGAGARENDFFWGEGGSLGKYFCFTKNPNLKYFFRVWGGGLGGGGGVSGLGVV